VSANDEHLVEESVLEGPKGGQYPDGAHLTEAGTL